MFWVRSPPAPGAFYRGSPPGWAQGLQCSSPSCPRGVLPGFAIWMGSDLQVYPPNPGPTLPEGLAGPGSSAWRLPDAGQILVEEIGKGCQGIEPWARGLRA